VSPPTDPFAQRPANLAEAQAVIAALQQRLAAAGLQHRAPPPVPEACCGRGCQGCVWEGYYHALLYWHDDAHAALAAAPHPTSP
jgi:hypothetical protein